MADLIRNDLGIETDLIVGYPGEFKVLVDDEVVARKGLFSLPTPEKCLAAVRKSITR